MYLMNPAIIPGVKYGCTPVARMKSAHPSLIILKESPTACKLVEQAVITLVFGPYEE
jgi:hypothetical protein